MDEVSPPGMLECLLGHETLLQDARNSDGVHHQSAVSPASDAGLQPWYRTHQAQMAFARICGSDLQVLQTSRGSAPRTVAVFKNSLMPTCSFTAAARRMRKASRAGLPLHKACRRVTARSIARRSAGARCRPCLHVCTRQARCSLEAASIHICRCFLAPPARASSTPKQLYSVASCSV